MALDLTTHTVMWCAHSSGVIRNKTGNLSGAREHLVEGLNPNGTFAFQEADTKKKRVSQWHCVTSNKCTESDSTVSKLTRKRLIEDPNYQFVMYETVTMDVNRAAAACNNDV